MAATTSGRFVRIPTDLLEALLRLRLSGTQWRLLLWVVRHTYGWNREWTPFTWYRVAKELGMDRAAVYRAGEVLIQAQMLMLKEQRLAPQIDDRLWDRRLFAPTGDARQLWMPGINVVGEQRRPLSADNAIVVGGQPKRCQEATLFRRVKDSSKDKLKTYKDRHRHKGDEALRRTKTVNEPSERRLLAGAARPIPGKYDSLSQD